MELEKIRNLSDTEMSVEQNKTAEQLFRLRFQLTLGQTDAVKKVRLLRKDIARFKTIARERELGLHGAEHLAESIAAEKPAKRAATPAAKKAPAKRVAAKKSATKTTAAKKAVKKSTTRKGAR